MKIQYCNNCKKYTLEKTCTCKNKTVEAGYKFKKPKHLGLISEKIKNAYKTRKEQN